MGNVNYALAISTFFCKETDERRINLFEKSINSLIASEFKCQCFLVDDGSDSKEHIEWVRSLNHPQITIVEKEKNGGISRCKNTCMRLILESGAEIGYLADDDMLYKKGWDEAYAKSMSETNIHHFCFFADYDKCRTSIVPYGKGKVLRTPHTNGCFITFTKAVFEKMGNFVVLPYRYGHEHINFYFRCMAHGFLPFPCDIANSRDYLDYPKEAWEQTTLIRDEAKISLNVHKANTIIHGRHVGEE
jgi:GT2 family glycosyltransferase